MYAGITSLPSLEDGGRNVNKNLPLFLLLLIKNRTLFATI
jgi:hypothetical protein